MQDIKLEMLVHNIYHLNRDSDENICKSANFISSARYKVQGMINLWRQFWQLITSSDFFL